MSTTKYYSFLNITDGPDGTKNATTVVTLTKPQLRELEGGKKVLTCPAALTNREKALSTALDCEVKANGDTVWVDVNFWNTLADRFQKFLGDREKVRVCVCGRLSVRKWTAKDGTEAQRVQLSATDWFAIPSGTTASSAPASHEAPEVEEAGDEDLPF